MRYTQWCIPKNGGGYTQRGVAKGLKVPCLFMITEVSIRCPKKPGGWYTPYTRIYPQYTTSYTLLCPPAMGEGIKRCRDPSVRLSVPCGRQGLLGAQRHHQAARAVQTADPSMHRQFGLTYFMSSISHWHIINSFITFFIIFKKLSMFLKCF